MSSRADSIAHIAARSGLTEMETAFVIVMLFIVAVVIYGVTVEYQHYQIKDDIERSQENGKPDRQGK